MKKLAPVLALLFLMLGASSAAAQSACKYIVYNAVLTAAQWNYCFQQKSDNYGYVPVNKAGDTMLGRLIMAPSGSFAGLTISPGTTPSTLHDGDIWITISGLFFRNNGVTVTPAVTSNPLSQFAATSSAQLRGVISDETGTGQLVFATTPVISGLIVTGSLTATGLIGLPNLANQNSNTVLANVTGTTNPPTAIAVASCTGASAALQWQTNIGFTCGTVVTSAAAITVGTTAVASGATTRVLFDNAGTLGEYSVIGSASVAMTTSTTLTTPTLTTPTINGGTHTAITSLGVRDTSAAFDVTIAATSSPALTAGRTLTINMQNAARTISLAGDLTTAGAVTHAGAFATTITVSATTNSTLPAGTHTLAGLDVVQNWSAVQQFFDGDMIITGSTSGTLQLRAAATAGTSVVRFPAGSTDFSATGGANQFVKQTSAGGALTVAAILAGDLPLATNAAIGGMRGDGSTITCSAGVCTSLGGAAASIQVGVTTVNSGTNNNVLTSGTGTLANVTIASLHTAGTNIAITGTTNATISVSGIIAAANGGTNNGFFQVSGPASSAKTYTFPNASDTVAMLGQAQTFSGANIFTSNVGVGSGPLSVERLTVTFDGTSQYGQYFRETTGTTSGNFVVFDRVGSVIGSIAENGTTAVIYNTASDGRLKDDLKPIVNVRDKIAALTAYDFRWKATGDRGKGFIAQQAVSIIPEAVTIGGDDAKTSPWQIDYSKAVPTLWANAQDANDRILILEKRVLRLERELHR